MTTPLPRFEIVRRFSMSRRQQIAIRRMVRFYTLDGHYGVSAFRRRDSQFSKSAVVQFTVCLKDPTGEYKGTLAEIFSRKTITFNIGPRGGISHIQEN